MRLNINVKAARERLSELLNRIHEGEESTILKHGKKVARLVPPVAERKQFPSMRGYRQSIQMKGDSLSETVLKNRREEQD